MDQNQILTIVAASVPTMITVLIGILINNSRLGDMNSRINSLELSVNRRIDDLRQHMDARFQAVDRRFDQIEQHSGGWPSLQASSSNAAVSLSGATP